MERVGTLCARGEIDVYHEHWPRSDSGRSCSSCAASYPRPGSGPALAAGAAPEGDPHVLPSLMVELTLLELGWSVLNLGPETPMAALAAAVRQHRPRLVWISITTRRPAPAFLEGCARLVDATRAERAGVIVGGHGPDSWPPPSGRGSRTSRDSPGRWRRDGPGRKRMTGRTEYPIESTSESDLGTLESLP